MIHTEANTVDSEQSQHYQFRAVFQDYSLWHAFHVRAYIVPTPWELCSIKIMCLCVYMCGHACANGCVCTHDMKEQFGRDERKQKCNIGDSWNLVLFHCLLLMTDRADSVISRGWVTHDTAPDIQASFHWTKMKQLPCAYRNILKGRNITRGHRVQGNILKKKSSTFTFFI